jgi:threonine dehydratase
MARQGDGMAATGEPSTAGVTRLVRPPTAAELAHAAGVVRAHLAPTPLVPVRLPARGGGTVDALVKLESAQPTGSFKVRGALAALDAYSRAGPGPSRVVTASAGNHGLGVAWAAGRLGVPATVVVPTSASAAKVEALAAMPIELVQHGDDYEAAERHALGLATDGGVFVSAYNDAHVIAGQATMAEEVVDEAGDNITLVVPVGGGGLLAGSALTAAGHPGLRLVGAESANSPAVSAAVAAGRVVPVQVEPSLADGLGGNLEPGSVTPAVAGPRVEGFVTADEHRIADAMRTLVTRAGLVAEGAAAVGFAALMAGEVPTDRQVVVVLTGRNVAAPLLARLLSGDDR